MKTWLMYPDRDFQLPGAMPDQAADLVQDLGLGSLFQAMAAGDAFLADAAKAALLNPMGTVEEVVYRQDVLKDFLAEPALLRELYGLTVAAVNGERKLWMGAGARYPGFRLQRSVQVLEIVLVALQGIRALVDRHGAGFRSSGLRRFRAMVQDELGDAFFTAVQAHLKVLRFREGLLMSAQLGEGNRSRGFVLRRPNQPEGGWWRRLFRRRPREFTFYIAERDETGAKAVSELKDRALSLVANAVTQSTDHILAFLAMLRAELAFHLGCVNLQDRLRQLGAPTAFPVPLPPGRRCHVATGAYDVGLALATGRSAVGSDLQAEDRNLVVITGANQGGKTTYLRALGLAQLMLQSGMFVPAQAFRANLCDGLHTHFKREEDAGMKSGKLDEELERMSGIVGRLGPDALVLCNESFAATNEREGSEIARQVVSALVEQGITVFFVTHLYELAHGMEAAFGAAACFLRAAPPAPGPARFRLEPGEPLRTSHGVEVYRQVFQEQGPGPAAIPGPARSCHDASSGDGVHLEPPQR
jgi:hypothetical protein